MRMLVDGVFYQLASTGIARVWTTLLELLAAKNDIEILLLDRGKAPVLAGIKNIPFPSYHDRYTSDDSLLLQKLCDHYEVEVFASTYFTSPIAVPMLLLVCDMIPEVLGFDLSERFWMEKEIAISFAQGLITISHQTKRDLLRFYPEIPDEMVSVAHLGYDRAVFKPSDLEKVQAFRSRLAIEKPYLLLVGAREQHKGYKNTRLLFEAVGQLASVDFDILCAGGESEIDPASLAFLPKGCKARRLLLTDDDLALAYGGAIALVYPSLYEGFGLPVLEAIACGCPVITTQHGSLSEIVDEDSCLAISGSSASQMVEALATVRKPEVRDRLIRSGLQRAKIFSWDDLANTMEGVLRSLAHQANQKKFEPFFSKWKQLRALQAEVDSGRIR